MWCPFLLILFVAGDFILLAVCTVSSIYGGKLWDMLKAPEKVELQVFLVSKLLFPRSKTNFHAQIYYFVNVILISCFDRILFGSNWNTMHNLHYFKVTLFFTHMWVNLCSISISWRQICFGMLFAAHLPCCFQSCNLLLFMQLPLALDVFAPQTHPNILISMDGSSSTVTGHKSFLTEPSVF